MSSGVSTTRKCKEHIWEPLKANKRSNPSISCHRSRAASSKRKKEVEQVTARERHRERERERERERDETIYD
jgi:hypothetical protein